ncbi:low molecular weight protein-tyrosine-phosphatase [Pseudoxanthobacter sp. M-2]|uniref:low molecular weight protein-tyrosine-phosphatase n=1 Tax=Pseudoxanthobacter sp. M-2 TaxID=3078754 RepID=UPI0038FC5C1E
MSRSDPEPRAEGPFPAPEEGEDRIGVLFVCLGNICRSPLAEGAFRHAVAARGLEHRFRIDSAGISDFHEGDQPDRRAIATAAARGLDISGQRSRPVRPGDFVAFDWILAMDGANLTALDAAAPDHATAHVGLLLEVAEGRAKAVPDPYYDGPAEFKAVLETVSRAAERLLDRLLGEPQLGRAAPKRRST